MQTVKNLHKNIYCQRVRIFSTNMKWSLWHYFEVQQESLTGRLPLHFPRSLYFYGIALEEPGSPASSCRPDTTCACGSKHGPLLRGISVRTPKIALDCNPLKWGVQRLLQSQDQNAKSFLGFGEGVGKTIEEKFIKSWIKPAPPLALEDPKPCSNRCQERIQGKYHYLLLHTYTLPTYSLPAVLRYRFLGKVDLESHTVFMWQHHLQSL